MEDTLDNHDIMVLRQLLAQLARATKVLIKLIKEEAILKVLLFEDLSRAEVKPTLSFDNKLIELMTSKPHSRILIEDYVNTSANVKRVKYDIDQIQEQINGIKKIIDITPR